MAVDKLVDSTQLDADLTSVANAIRTKGGTSASLAFPSDFVTAIAAISGGGGGGKTQIGTFTGNGTKSASISCDFEPDIVYWWTDTGGSTFTGTYSGMIARDMLEVNRYYNNSTSVTNIVQKATGMNEGYSSYNMRATYENGTVTISCYTNGARSYFKNGQSYTYKFAKWTA